jgi:hypothetical protein
MPQHLTVKNEISTKPAVSVILLRLILKSTSYAVGAYKSRCVGVG